MMNPKYNQLLDTGPFPKQIDPWAEQGEYFHQLHGHMITYLLDAIQDPLLALGYRVGREASLQSSRKAHSKAILNYEEAALEAGLEAGVLIVDESPDLDKLVITSLNDNRIVTVIELISPSTKSTFSKIEQYQLLRDILAAQEVHFIEIDITRSTKRLINHSIAHSYPYHVLVHLWDDVPYFFGMRLADAPKKFALPLRGEIVPVPLDEIYHRAYRQLVLADKILENKHYSEEHLPFPSLMSEETRKALLAQVETWKAALQAAQG